MIEDLFGNLPFDGERGCIPKPAFDFDRAFDYLTANHLPLFLTGVSIFIGVVI